MWFKLRDVQLDFTENAPFRLLHEEIVEASPQEVFALLTGDRWLEWFPNLREMKWTGPEPRGVGTGRFVRTRLLSAQETFLAWDPGKRFCFVVNSISLPVVRALVEDVRLEAMGPGRTKVCWNSLYEPTLVVRLIHPIVRWVFSRLFKGGITGLKAFLEKPGK